MNVPGSPSKFLLGIALMAGLSACGSDNDLRNPGAVSAGDTFALTSGNQLISFNRNAPGTARTSVAITGLNAGDALIGFDFRPANGQLYAVGTSGTIYTLNTATGAATAGPVITGATLSGTAFGVDFNPVPDRLRVVSNSGQNLRINVETGAAIVDGALALNGVPSTGITAAAYTNSFGAACRTALFYIDTTNSTLLTTSAPNEGIVTTVGPLGVTAANALSAFEINTSDAGANLALAVLTTAGGPVLHTINTSTGAATAIGVIGGAAASGQAVRGLATAPPAATPVQAAGEIYGVTESNRLVTFNRAAPAKLCTTAPITGLNTGENVAGIDFRPSTGVLHALGNANGTARLLTLDPATAAASAPVAISQALVGTDFGMDFNPTGPVALRIVSDSGQNLRVTDIATGATTADGALNGASTGATAAAYTNSVAGTGTTTLYVIDPATDTLNIQNPPNAGTLVSVGGLGADIGAVNGFDIDGRDNVALVAVSAMGATTSTLHTVDLASGAASASLGVVGGGERLRGITRPTPTTTVFGVRNGNELVQLSLADPTVLTPIGTISGLTTDTALVGIDFRPSTRVLYGVGNAGGLYVIDPATAAASGRVTLSTLPDAVATGFGVDFNPAVAAVPLRIVGDTEQNLRVGDLVAGTTTADIALTRAAETFSIAAVGYTNSVTPNPTSTVLYGLDSAGDRLVAINPPNGGVVRVIGPTNVPVTANSTLEIVGANTAIAILDTTPEDKAVYSIDLTTGAATLIGSTDGPLDPIQGIAAPVTATPMANSLIYAADAGNNLISFARNAPGTRILDIPISGIGVGETIAGIDFRSLDGLLWMLTNNAGTGRLYTVDLVSGVATPRGTLTATLSGSNFAMDFNPMPAIVPLRIISDTGQNLRVTDLVTGATATDTALNQPTPNANAAAYTNSFVTPAGTTASTALFVIDAATGSLLRQGLATPPGPNGGVLSNVGALSAGDSFGPDSGFDIAGGANGVSLAALQRIATPAETASRLYRVNILTGAATEVVPGALIGGASSAELTGLAIRIQ